MCTRGLYVFEHDSMLGNAQAHELFDRIKIDRLGSDAAPRSFDDYRSRIQVVEEGMPASVKLHRFVG